MCSWVVVFLGILLVGLYTHVVSGMNDSTKDYFQFENGMVNIVQSQSYKSLLIYLPLGSPDEDTSSEAVDLWFFIGAMFATLRQNNLIMGTR